MDTCKVKLTVARSGPKLNQQRGDEVEVGLLEAGRLLRNGAIERPAAKVLKAIADAEAAEGRETAVASGGAAAAPDAAAADEDAPAPDAAVAGEDASAAAAE